MTMEEKMIKVAENWMAMIDEAREIAVSADSVAEKSLQYWQPNTLYKAGQVVYVRISWDFYDEIYKCVATHASPEYFSTNYDGVEMWKSLGMVKAGFAEDASRADSATYAQIAGADEDMNPIISTYAKKMELDTKADKTEISSIFFSTFPFEFSSMYNQEMRLLGQGETVESLSFTFGNGEYQPDYASGLSFDSGSTPTAIDYTDSGILNWVGTDCVTSDGLSIFQPSANTHYDIVFYFNGKQFIGLVNGFVPSIEWQGALPTGNEAV